MVKKHSFCGATKWHLIVPMPQKACSAILHGFEPRSRDYKPTFLIDFIYNAEDLIAKEFYFEKEE